MAKPPDLSPEELDALSSIAPSDKQEAAAAWVADAPRVAANLLDATEHAGDA